MKNRNSNSRQRDIFFVSRILFVLFCLSLLVIPAGRASAGWEQVGEILSRIKAPQFPKRNFNITDYGAVANNKKDCTDAFRRAISAAQEAGGGRVVVPSGRFMTGPIHLKSNVNLYVSDGAVINFFVDPGKYMPVVYSRFEGTECMNYSPLVYAYEQENIAISGKSKYALSISGYERSPITGIRLKNCIFDNVEKSDILVGVKNLAMENVKIDRRPAK